MIPDRAEKSARMQTFTPSHRSPSPPSLCPDHSTHSRSHFNNHNTVGRTGKEKKKRQYGPSTVRPSVFPLPMSPCLRNGLSRGAAPLGEGRLACCPAAAGKRGLSAATATATTRSFFEVPEQRSGKEGRREGNLARLHSLLMHSQSVTKLQGIEEQQ